jgi:hypothetical protein
MIGQLETPREGLMNIAASFPSVMKPRYINPVGKSQTPVGDARYLRDTPTRAPLMILVSASSISSNVEPAHNITNNFAPNLR